MAAGPFSRVREGRISSRCRTWAFLQSKAEAVGARGASELSIPPHRAAAGMRVAGCAVIANASCQLNETPTGGQPVAARREHAAGLERLVCWVARGRVEKCKRMGAPRASGMLVRVLGMERLSSSARSVPFGNDTAMLCLMCPVNKKWVWCGTTLKPGRTEERSRQTWDERCAIASSIGRLLRQHCIGGARMQQVASPGDMIAAHDACQRKASVETRRPRRYRALPAPWWDRLL